MLARILQANAVIAFPAYELAAVNEICNPALERRDLSTLDGVAHTAIVVSQYKTAMLAISL